MAKFAGPIGYATLSETAPGVWEEEIIERNYCGDLIRNSQRLQSGSDVNDSVNISNKISIVADPFAFENFHHMRYATYMGIKWKINDVDATSYPRLVMSLGGEYND